MMHLADGHAGRIPNCSDSGSRGGDRCSSVGHRPTDARRRHRSRHAAIAEARWDSIVMLKRYPAYRASCSPRRSGHAGCRRRVSTRTRRAVIGPLPHGLPTRPFHSLTRRPGAGPRGRAVRSHSFRLPTRACFHRGRMLRACARPSIRTKRSRWAWRRQISLLASFRDFPHQQQFLADAGSRGRGLEDPVDGSGGRTGHCAAPRSEQELAPLPAQHGARCRCHCRRYRTLRSRRFAPHLPHPALGVLVVDGLLRGSGGAQPPFQASRSRSQSP